MGQILRSDSCRPRSCQSCHINANPRNSGNFTSSSCWSSVRVRCILSEDHGTAVRLYSRSRIQLKWVIFFFSSILENYARPTYGRTIRPTPLFLYLPCVMSRNNVSLHSSAEKAVRGRSRSFGVEFLKFRALLTEMVWWQMLGDLFCNSLSVLCLDWERASHFSLLFESSCGIVRKAAKNASHFIVHNDFVKYCTTTRDDAKAWYSREELWTDNEESVDIRIESRQFGTSWWWNIRS